VWGYMYYNTPFSLFPPNAAISLTDDNSTSFAARPAAFGPKLHARGLSGQLWVGSGFSEDTSDTDGELGCSDLPAWDREEGRKSLRNTLRAATAPSVSTSTRRMTPGRRTASDSLLDRDNRDAIAKSKQDIPDTDERTGDHEHGSGKPSTAVHQTSHADIQSIQEGAEIEGKVALLMRGGCGFLDKVMWAQRRGAVAVIVGDNRKGGPLIQMFAHGEEVDNVTIPSVFTARTTAQLLSSLTQPGSFIEDALDDHGRQTLKVQQGRKLEETKPEADAVMSKKQKRAAMPMMARAVTPTPPKRSWFSRMFWGSARASDGASSPSNSDWVMVEEWNDEKEADTRQSKDQSNADADDDAFVIGVHDWRDPDLVGQDHSGHTDSFEKIKSDPAITKVSKSPEKGSQDLRHSKVTQGNGEYNPYKALTKSVKNSAFRDEILESSRHSRTLMGKVFGSRTEDHRLFEASLDKPMEDDPKDPTTPSQPDSGAHEGLWVTITPTSSATPFFDTLLVLVISPLVTLTVVYALLILRARIRRRRWRAPKSVVEQLPVRTYHTVAASISPSPRQPSPSSTSPTTPLLQQNPPRRSRPRSRTTTGVPESDSSLLTPTSAVPTPPRTSSRHGRSEHEKGAGGFSAEWRKYMGRQVECVVCLEEYVDGVSQVMSLPCGHEFHVDCITPWLTTRRRTCPICKGDVVRSLAGGSSSSPLYDSYHDDSDDEPSDEVGEASGTHATDDERDVEQGILSGTHEPSRQDNWTSFWPSSFSPRRPGTPPPRGDRNR